MAINPRRVIFFSCLLLFFVLTGAVIIQTGGYHFIGHWQWRRTGAVSISSAPRATVALNGNPVGQTPQRLTNLDPGQYTLQLTKPGYTSWRSTITVAGGLAQTIGPVVLFPATYTTTTTPIPAHGNIFVDTTTTQPFLASPTPTQTWQLRNMVTSQVFTTAGLNTPETISASPHGTILAISGGSTTEFVGSTGSVISVPRLSNLTWTSLSDDVAYGLRSGMVERVDMLAQKVDQLLIAQSVTANGEWLFLTQSSATKTTILRFDGTPNTKPATIQTWPGDWSVHAGPGNHLIFTNVDKNTTLGTVRLNGSISMESIGHADSVFWHQHDGGPIWQSGVNLAVRPASTTGPRLLDRISEPLLDAQWYLPNSIAITIDQHQIVVRAVLPSQGQTTVTEFPVPEGLTWLATDQRGQGIWWRSGSSLVHWTWAIAL